MPQSTPIPQLSSTSQRLRATLTQGLEHAGQTTANHPAIALAILLLIWFAYAFDYSLNLPLWHDELFTYFIAQTPTVRELLHQTQYVDLNPPLSYLLTRASFHLFGVGTMQTRLPEILGFALALVAMFLFVRRRAGNALGLLATAILLAAKPSEASIQARPYGLMLGFIMLSFVAWQASSDATRRSRNANLLLFASLSALLLTHVFGLFAWAALAAAEAVQSFQQRRLNLPRILAMLLPLTATILFIPLLRNHGLSAYPPSFAASPTDVFTFYIGHIDRELICLWLSAAIVVFTAGRRWLHPGPTFFLSLPEWVAVSTLIATPLLLIFRLMLAHAAFFERYGVAGSLGICILFTVLYGWWTNSRPAAAFIAGLIAILIAGQLPNAIAAIAQGHIFRHTEPATATFPLDALRDPTLPLVDASGLTFVEMNHREPNQLLDRTFYLTGGLVALQYAHATIFESMPKEVVEFHLRARSELYTQFIHEHPHFYVFGTFDYPEDWLLRKLLADGATLRRIGTVDTSYLNHELWDVTIPSSQ